MKQIALPGPEPEQDQPRQFFARWGLTSPPFRVALAGALMVLAVLVLLVSSGCLDKGQRSANIGPFDAGHQVPSVDGGAHHVGPRDSGNGLGDNGEVSDTGRGADLLPMDHVVVILLDGVRPDSLQEAQTPNLDRLSAEGASTWNAWTVWPPMTITAVPSLHTGAEPDVHQVDSWRGSIAAETLVHPFKEAGLSTAIVGADAILGGYEADHVTGHYHHPQGDAHFTDKAMELFEAHRPHFLFLYNPVPDSVGHQHGHWSSQYKESIERADVQVGRLMASFEGLGVLDNTLMVVTTDHGMTGNAHGYGFETDFRIFSIWRGPNIKRGYSMVADRLIPAQASGSVLVTARAIGASQQWSESTVTWNNRPEFGESVDQVLVQSEGWSWWDLTPWVEEVLAGGRQQVSVGLQGEGGSSSPTHNEKGAVYFNSKEWNQQDSHPRMVVEYRLGPSQNPMSLLLPPVADALVESGSPHANFGDRQNFYVGRFHRGEGRSLLRFDLSAIPQGAILEKASLGLYCWRTGPVGHGEQVVSHRMTDVAVTITTLKGLRPPRHSSGVPIHQIIIPAEPRVGEQK